MREWILGVLLAVAAAAVVAGVALSVSVGVALIVGGVLLGLWSWLMFGEVAG